MNRIREIRKAAGISQSMLYRQLGWSQARLSNYERGIRNVGLADARSVVSALSAMGVVCSLDDVFPPTTSQKTTSSPRASSTQADGVDSRDGRPA
ncbi:helix-turn-helix domain-containing protein [Azotobacter vinelandii]|uniref:helix-turn-helix domain-containing protein n=1 Tax=Azotobacter vinelandii TaxID=354 RepID=UPI0009E888FA|nr:helix-turn-helix transcriptional regulator [Azotobacter vinelandii]WKN21513.1 helix-turn-helix domain-containing protein [Azotobacter vinelandii]